MISRPITGITKKPTTAPSAPASRVVAGAPRAAAERAGSRYFATVPRTNSALIRPKTVHRAGPPPSAIAHARPASQISRTPGTTGTSTPIRPTTIASPTASCPPPVTIRSPLEGQPVRPGPDPGTAGSAPDAGAVAGADAGEVQREQQQAEHQQRLPGERVTQVRVGPVQDQREREHDCRGEGEHVKPFESRTPSDAGVLPPPDDLETRHVAGPRSQRGVTGAGVR